MLSEVRTCFLQIGLCLAALFLQAGCSTATVSSEGSSSPSTVRSPIPVNGSHSRREKIRIFTVVEDL